MKIIFTIHAEEQLQERSVLKEEIFDTVHYPDKVLKKYGKYRYQKKFQRGIIEVVCKRTETHIKVITVYWR